MSEFSVIGKRLPKLDAKIKVTGQAKYADDLSFLGMLYGKLLRSPHPHARIVHIDASKAERIPGVRAVITGKDFPGIPYGNFAHTRDYLPLALDRVRYIGEEVAAVAADSEDIAEEAVGLIEVKYELLPAIYDPEEALKEGAVQLYDDRPNNISSLCKNDYGDVEKGFAEADYIREDVFETQAVRHGMLETHSCIGFWEATGNVVLYSCKMSPYPTYRQLAMGLGVSLGRVRVVQTYIGAGMSGGKQEAMPMDFAAILLSKKTGRHVKITHTMEEVLTIGHMAHPFKIWLKTGVKKDGTITATHCRIIADGGAHSSVGQLTMYIPSGMLNLPYRIPNIKYEAHRVFTNKAFAGALRGHSAPQVYFAREQQFDMICEELGLDRLEFARKNAVQPGVTLPNGMKITTYAFKEAIEKVSKLSGWEKKKNKLPRNRGIGVGCGALVSGVKFMGHSAAAAQIRVQEDGTVLLSSGATDVGQGCDTVLSQIAAEILGVHLEDVRFALVDTDKTPIDPGTFSSRVTVWSGNAVKAAAEDARKQIAEVAAGMFEVGPEDIEMKNRRVYVKSNPEKGAPIGIVMRLADSQGKVIMGRGYWCMADEKVDLIRGMGNLSPSYTCTAQVAEVEVDPETGVVKIIGFYGAHDCGRELNPMLVEGQCHGAAVMGIGRVLWEDVMRKDGTILNPNLIDYKMPTAMDIPPLANIASENVGSPDPNGPFGAKEAGEGIGTGILGAVANAIYDAVGVRITTMPITSEKILQALKEKEKKAEEESR
jgi:4-hydroxybenzoyl-CoA reductase subunit alpha